MARRKTGSFWRPRMEVLDEWEWNAATPSSLDFDRLKAVKGRRARLHVYAGAALIKLLTIKLPANLHGEREQKLAAQAHMQDQLGLNPEEWELAIDPARLPAASIVCAIRRGFMDRVRELSTQNNLRLVSLKPFVVGVWNAFQNKRMPASGMRSALIMIEQDAFTTVVDQSGTVEFITTLLHMREGDLVERELRRLSFSGNEIASPDIRLAMPDDLLSLVNNNGDKALRQSDYLQPIKYPDFRDLLFLHNSGCNDQVTA